MNIEHETPTASDSVCAVVVAYFPDEGFNKRLQTLLPQVGKVVVIDNTPEDRATSRLKITLQEVVQILCIDNLNNVGIAAALNQGLVHCSKERYKWMLTLDQDTQCYPDMVNTLLEVSHACQLKPTIVGGNYFDPQSDRTKVPAGQGGDFLEQKTVITSGSLIDVRLAIAMGGFREDYFIDQVDHEFCLRARTHGHKVVISSKPVMTHSVGRDGGVRIPILGVLPNHPPLRKYYIARNTVVTVAEYWLREPQWCARRLLRMLLGLGFMAILEEQRWSKVRAFAAGVADGLRGRMGPCTRTNIHL
jgi:rhamnosyltransferase